MCHRQQQQQFNNIYYCNFTEKPAHSSDHLDLDWIPNKNLGRFSKNWKLVEYHFRKIKKHELVNFFISQSFSNNHLRD